MVDNCHHGGDGGRFTGPGGADHQHKPPLVHGQLGKNLRHVDLVQSRHVQGDETQDHRQIAALIEHVSPEPPQALPGNREVDLQFPVQVLDLLFGHDSVGGGRDLLDG